MNWLQARGVVVEPLKVMSDGPSRSDQFGRSIHHRAGSDDLRDILQSRALDVRNGSGLRASWPRIQNLRLGSWSRAHVKAFRHNTTDDSLHRFNHQSLVQVVQQFDLGDLALRLLGVLLLVGTVMAQAYQDREWIAGEV